MGSVRDNGYGLPAAMRRAAAVVADPHRADRRGKGRDKEVEVKGQRAGQSDRRCESGHRQTRLAARPRVWRAGALSWAMAIRHSATPASGRAMRCGNGLEVRGCGTWMQVPATRWCLVWRSVPRRAADGGRERMYRCSGHTRAAT